jgi:hypothetical protein
MTAMDGDKPEPAEAEDEGSRANRLRHEQIEAEQAHGADLVRRYGYAPIARPTRANLGHPGFKHRRWGRGR